MSGLCPRRVPRHAHPFWVPVGNHLLQALLRQTPPQGSPPEGPGQAGGSLSTLTHTACVAPRSRAALRPALPVSGSISEPGRDPPCKGRSSSTQTHSARGQESGGREQAGSRAPSGSAPKHRRKVPERAGGLPSMSGPPAGLPGDWAESWHLPEPPASQGRASQEGPGRGRGWPGQGSPGRLWQFLQRPYRWPWTVTDPPSPPPHGSGRLPAPRSPACKGPGIRRGEGQDWGARASCPAV